VFGHTCQCFAQLKDIQNVWFAVLVQLGLFENGVYKNPVSK